MPDSGCLGRSGMESFLEPQLITHAVHVRVDPETGVVRVLRVAAAHDSGTILNPVGADGQVLGGVVMGIGQALSEGHAARRGRSPAQRAPARLQARDLSGRAADRHRVGGDSRGQRRSERFEGDGRAAVRADARGDRERDRARDGQARAAAADDARAHLGGGAVSASLLVASTVEDAVRELAAGARAVAGGTDLVVGARQGKAPLPARLVAIHRLEELRRTGQADGVLRAWAR